MTRTGYKEATDALARFNLKPTKAKYCPNVTTNFQWLAIPLSARNSTVNSGDVAFEANTLTRLVSDVFQANGETPPKGPESHQRDNGPEDPPSQNVPQEQSSGSQGTVDAAIRELLRATGAGVDERKVREIVENVAGESIQRATDSAQAEVDRRIKEAVKAVSEAIPVKFEVKIPDRESFKVEGEHNLFPTLCQEIALGHGVLLCGPAGSGKTTAAERAGEKLGMQVFVQPPVSDRFELLGFVDAGGTYQPSPAYRWATTRGSLLILDEMDRSHPHALTAVHSMLANGLAVFPHEQVRIPEENRIVATANTWGIGPDAEYTGSARLDAATLNRFPTRMDWDYDTGLETRIAVANGGDAQEAGYCQRLRAEINKRKIRMVWSPRDTIAHTRRVAAGVSRKESLERSVLATLKPEQRAEITGGL